MLKRLALSSPLWLAAGLSAQDPTSAQLTFFEEQIRPILSRRCHGCHGPDKQKSGLRLDHIRSIVAGGERGPAIVPGDSDTSRMLRAIGYDDKDLQMPPKRRLPTGEIERLRRWVSMGAPWPDEPLPKARATKEASFDLPARHAAHWAWRPLRESRPRGEPDPEWRHNPIDRMIRAKLREMQLPPAGLSDKSTLLRRVTFDLIGLPPTVADQAAFSRDRTAGAYAAVVDRLLASPRFGEHQARRWLDLVRFAETLGHEFDYPVPNAWRYRDYVIRALNADVPYDQFVREHIAGDLMDEPRVHPAEGFNESIIGTGFYWFAEQAHSPVDVRKHTADRTHNQIDVLTKTFLGLTVGCARCHDHKFDAISTADYYALAGFLKSSRYVQQDVSAARAPEQVAAFRRSSGQLVNAWAARVSEIAADVRRYLLAIDGDKAEGLSPQRLRAWREARRDAKIKRDPLHPMRGFYELERVRRQPGGDVRTAWTSSTPTIVTNGSDPDLVVDFRRDDFSDWFVSGRAFGQRPMRKSFLVRGKAGVPRVRSGGWAFSAGSGLHAQGVLHSPTFRIAKRYLHIRAFGRGTRINVVLEGFNLIRNPIYGQLKQTVNSDAPRWFTIDLRMWQGKRAYLVFCDQVPADLGDSRKKSYPRDGFLAVQQVRFGTDSRPPAIQSDLPARILGSSGEPVRTLRQLADLYARAIELAGTALTNDTLDVDQARLLDWMGEQGLLGVEGAAMRKLREGAQRADAAAANVMLVPGMADGTGQDENVFVRGGHNNLGPIIGRRFLTALCGERPEPMAAGDGSGRARLAEAILAPDNPFAARVMVNRLWHHVFGRGLVATVDNFGVQGEPPSHPRLLDWLALQFVRDGWSIKQTLRRMVLSRTYRMASSGDATADDRDPDLRWLHRMPIRRLPGEAIRDAILHTSGRLDPELFGPGVSMHLTKFMTGRGKPRSGPLDGAGRRSVYLRVNRNFLSPFLLAFDMPIPSSTIGRRNTTNVPAQALAMLNDPFVEGQARLWAKRIIAAAATTPERIALLYKQAFARATHARERRRVMEFLRRQGSAYRCDLTDPRPWQDLCHALFNVKEFIFVR